MAEFTTVREEIPVALSNQTYGRRRLFAGVLSVLVPGVGQLFCGQLLASSLFLAAYAAIFLCVVFLRIPKTLSGLLILLAGTPSVVIGASLHAAYSRQGNAQRLSKWWIPLLLFLALASTYLHFNLPVRMAGFRPFGVPSSSMEPTIDQGEHIIVDLRCFHKRAPKHGDIAIFRREGLYVVKRVIAVGGETIEGRENRVFIDDRLITEPYAVHIQEVPTESLANFGPLKIPNGKLFVIGDNRDVSYDSRQPEYGPIDVKEVYGCPLYVIRSTKSGREGREIR